jgi:hypothetical protein
MPAALHAMRGLRRGAASPRVAEWENGLQDTFRHARFSRTLRRFKTYRFSSSAIPALICKGLQRKANDERFSRSLIP